MKYIVKPEIVIDEDDPVAARNIVLRILSAAELAGKIYHFQVPEAIKGE